ncbi:MAG: nitroreductase family protein, partial [Erysipelotrichaceae bacterium]|nr:nitroreductase family protein [Erysipelotrichaceae bacterium]
GYDTNPIGGFIEEGLAESVGLDPNRYVPMMVIAMGKAMESGYHSLRLPVDTITTWK